jgi:hypothetical protein
MVEEAGRQLVMQDDRSIVADVAIDLMMKWFAAVRRAVLPISTSTLDVQFELLFRYFSRFSVLHLHQLHIVQCPSNFRTDNDILYIII